VPSKAGSENARNSIRTSQFLMADAIANLEDNSKRKDPEVASDSKNSQYHFPFFMYNLVMRSIKGDEKRRAEVSSCISINALFNLYNMTDYPDNLPDNIMNNIRLICNETKLAYDPLTKDQKEYVDTYEKNKDQYKCVHIDGPAGSGKTFIALYIIIQTLLELLKTTQEKCILIVCTKNSLAMFLARWILIRILSKNPILYTDDEGKGESDNNMVEPR